MLVSVSSYLYYFIKIGTEESVTSGIARLASARAQLSLNVTQSACAVKRGTSTRKHCIVDLFVFEFIMCSSIRLRV